MQLGERRHSLRKARFTESALELRKVTDKTSRSASHLNFHLDIWVPYSLYPPRVIFFPFKDPSAVSSEKVFWRNLWTMRRHSNNFLYMKLYVINSSFRVYPAIVSLHMKTGNTLKSYSWDQAVSAVKPEGRDTNLSHGFLSPSTLRILKQRWKGPNSLAWQPYRT